MRFMQGPWLPDLPSAHKERNWPALGDAAEDLSRLRRLFNRALKNLAAFAHDGEILAWAEQEPDVSERVAKWARNRRLCGTCGWNLNYRRAKCPYSYPACPSFDPTETPFECVAYGAHAVSLAGSFSAWRQIALEELDYGQWAIRVQIGPGIHRYKFIVDGVWQTDPSNSRTELDESGNVNSIIVTRGQHIPP